MGIFDSVFDNPKGLFPVSPGTPIPEGVDIVDPKIYEGRGAPPLGCNIGTDCEKALVIFIGGAADTDYRPMYREFASYCREGHEHQAKAYFTHDANSAIVRYITRWRKRYPGHQVGLIGHSWGGYRAYEVAQRLAEDGVPLDLLVTLDPVKNGTITQRKSASGFGNADNPVEMRPTERPETTKRWYNVFVRDNPAIPICPDVPMITSNRVARNGGGSWRDLKLKGLVDDEWTIESAHDPRHNLQCHKDNGHELVEPMLSHVKTFVVKIT
jgi:pimeloyl-ACP methyl ester carboxylesterase